MKKLDKTQTARLNELAARLDAAKSALEAEVTTYNEEKSRLFGKVEAAIEKYNEVVSDFEAFREEVHTDMENYWDDRSENWQNGDNGQTYSDWMDRWREEQPQHELQEPDDVEVDLNGSEQIFSEYPADPGD